MSFILYGKYKSFTELFVKKFNKKCHGVEATIHWIKNYLLVKVPSVRQVFRWINAKIWTIKRSNCLRRKIGMYSKIDNKYCIPYVLRPKKINNREEFGHWEVNLIVSKRESGYHHLLTFVKHKIERS